MLLVPRRREKWEVVSVNALGYAGSLFVRDSGQLEEEESSGFGKIFVTELLDVVRIRTGERGPDAI